MKKIITLSCLLLVPQVFSNIGPQGFGNYKNTYFVETGTLIGRGIERALQAGFKEIRSIEADDSLVRYTRMTLGEHDNVKIYHGSSADILWDVIKDIEQPITFWLDAHIYPPSEGVQNCPLIEELEQIKRHPIKNHTILIDDMRCSGTDAFDGITKEDLVAKILEINPNYQISYIDGGDAGEYPQDIMVAIVK